MPAGGLVPAPAADIEDPPGRPKESRLWPPAGPLPDRQAGKHGL